MSPKVSIDKAIDTIGLYLILFWIDLVKGCYTAILFVL